LDPQTTVSIDQFAKAANIHHHTAQRWVAQGRVTAEKDAAGRWRIPISELERLIREANTNADARN
jgi:excisionase family DNA binding protein